MDENKVIRVILEARDGLTGVLAKARKNAKKELDELDKTFFQSRKGLNLYEDDIEDLGDSLINLGDGADSATISITKMSKALDEADKRVKTLKKSAREGIIGIVQDVKGETRGRRTVRDAVTGRVIPGKGLDPSDRVLVNKLTKETVKINRALNDVLSAGYKIAKNTQKALDDELGATKEIRKQRLKTAEEVNRQAKIKLSANQDERRAEEADIIEVETRKSGLLEERIALQKRQNAAQKKFEESRTDEDLEAASKLETELKFLENRINQIKRNISTERTRQFQQERQDLARNFNEEKANIKNLSKEDAKRIIEEVKLRRKALLKSGTKRDQVGKRVGFAVGDFFGGISRGKSNVRDLDEDLEKLASKFGRLGFAIGGAFKDMNRFVNLRWLFITSVITLLINVLTQLVVVLVSVASSAILAGSALGAGLIAGVAQAIPVVALLAGAFKQLGEVMKAVEDQEKVSIERANDIKEGAEKRRQALQRLADASYSVKQAIQSVADAEYDFVQRNKDVVEAIARQKDAQKELAEARVQASQDIIDANLREKDSALALEEAELAVLQAKEKLRQEEEKGKKGATDVAQAQAAVKEAQDRLNLAKTQGDNSEVIKASQQLSLANQNLDAIQDNIDKSKGDIADARLGVERAEINRQQAANRKRKDAKEAQILRQKGISQADIVLQVEKDLAAATEGIVDAQRAVAESQRAIAEATRSVAVAKREEADARRALADSTNFQSAAQKNLAETIADFSPAEKKLYESLLRVKAAYKNAFSGTKGKDGILAPILNGFALIADAITGILTDPQIIKSLGTLAETIGDGIGRFANLITSDDFKEDMLFFIEQATDNLPKVFNILIDIFNILKDIGKEAAPIFSELLDGLSGVTGKAARGVGQTVGSQNFNGRPEEGTRGALAPAQQTRLGKFLENANKHLKAWLDLGKAIGNVINQLINVSASTGKSLIESATEALNNLATFIKENPEEVSDFFNEIADSFKVLASALLGLIVIFGKAAKDENVQNFALFLVEVIVPGLYLMITAVGLFAGALDALTKIPVLGWFVEWGLKILVAEKALNELFPITQGLTNLIRQGLGKAFGFLFFAITKPLQTLAAFKTLIQVIALRLATLSSTLTLLALRILPLLGTAFTAATGSVGLIILAIIAIGTAIYLLDKKFHFIRPTIEFFWKQFKRIFDWVKNHWRLVTALLTGPVGVAVLLIIKHWNKVKDVLFGLPGLLLDKYYKPLYNILIQPFVEASAFIIKLFKKLPGILGNILKKIPGLGFLIKQGGKVGGVLKNIFGDEVSGAVKGAKAVGGAAKGAVKGAGNLADDAEVALGGERKVTATDILQQAESTHGKLIRRLRAKGMSDKAILKFLLKGNKFLKRKNFEKRFGVKLADVQGFSVGSSGVKSGANKIGATDTIPAMLTPGEWVLNKNQLRQLMKITGMSFQQLKANVFGTNMGQHTGNPGVRGTAGSGGNKLKPSKRHNPILSGSFSLVPQEDDDGNTVWFLQLADGTFGQVTGRDATKIEKSNGKYIPGYVRRNSHGFRQRISTEMNPLGFANGGIIPQGVRGFAEGGIVQSPGFGNTTNKGTEINQNFNVKTEGTTDWAYVMRLSAITAQSAF